MEELEKMEELERLEKNNILNEFIEKFSYLAPQGSAGWHDRKHVGGSEMAILNGTNSFTNLHK
jgi:hypothetical protein